MDDDRNSDQITATILINKINTLAESYKKYGFSGLTVAAGILLIIFTFIVAVQTSASDPSNSFLNVSATEEAIFLAAGLVLVVLGGTYLIVKSILIHRFSVLEIEVRLEEIRFKHKNLILLEQAIRNGYQPTPGPDIPDG